MITGVIFGIIPALHAATPRWGDALLSIVSPTLGSTSAPPSGMAIPQQFSAADMDASREDRYPWPWTGYSDKPTEMPLAGYGALLAIYAGVFGTIFGVLGSRRQLPERMDMRDVVLFGIATHKIGHILTRDCVTSPLRAPFTAYQESTGGGEVAEQSRGEGLRRATGDLLTCQWCIAPWVAALLYATHLVNHRASRLVAAASTSVAISDFLQHLYSAAKRISR